jgi:hypothetical protein
MKSRPSPRCLFVLLGFVCIAAAAFTTRAASAADEPANYPTDFLATAKAFASAPVTDRYSEAYNLNKKIPKPPRMNAANSSGRGRRSRNRQPNPTFVLREGDLPRLLGTARYTNSIAYGYSVTKDSCLWVVIHNGQVTDSTLSGRSPILATNLLETARAFRDAPATNRFNQAQALHNTLPTMPATGGSSITNPYDRDCRFVYKDADNPAFILREGDLMRLLGRPGYSDPECYAYPVTNAEKKEKELVIYFYNGLVVGSTIEDAPNPTSTK